MASESSSSSQSKLAVNTDESAPSLEGGMENPMPRSPSLVARVGDDAVGELEALLTIPFFDDLDRKHLRELYSHFEREEFDAGAIVQHEGAASGLAMSGKTPPKERSHRFQVVASGKVRMTARSSKDKEIELAVLGQGRWFGDLGFVPQKTASLVAPDAAAAQHIQPVSVRCVEPTVLLSIDAVKFDTFIKQYPKTGAAVQAAAAMPPLKTQLRKLPFFQHISEFKLQQLGVLFEFRKCDSGQDICRQGDDAKGFFILVKGRVHILVKNAEGHEVKLNTLRSGAWFGEIALLQETTRTATVRAAKTCTLLFLSRDRFNTFLRLAPEIRKSGVLDKAIAQRTANSLKAIPLFSFLDKKAGSESEVEDKLSILGQMFKFVEFDAGSVVFREGDAGDAFYIITAGTAVVTARVDKEDPTSEDMKLCELHENDWFGEIALVNKTSRTATVSCANKCSMLVLQSSDFDRFVALAPEIKESLSMMIRVRTAKSLRHVPFFQEVIPTEDTSKLDMLGGMFVFEEHKRGTVLFHQGEEGDKFYIIVQGVVRLTRYRLIDESEAPVVRDAAEAEAVADGNNAQPAAGSSSADAASATSEPAASDAAASAVAAAAASSSSGMAESASKFSLIVTDVDDSKDANKGSGDEADETASTGPIVEPRLIKGTVALEDLKDNSYFGEISLMKDILRTATAHCVTDCLFVSITKSQFRSFLNIAPDIRQHFSTVIRQRAATILSKFPLFGNLKNDKPWDKLDKLAGYMDWEQASSGETIFKYGDTPEKLYFIISGAVRVTIPKAIASSFDPDADTLSDLRSPEFAAGSPPIDPPPISAPGAGASADGAASDDDDDTPEPQHYICTLRQNAYFGEVALLRGVRRTATVTAVAPCVFVTLPASEFATFAREVPELLPVLNEAIASQYQFIRNSVKAAGGSS